MNKELIAIPCISTRYLTPQENILTGSSVGDVAPELWHIPVAIANRSETPEDVARIRKEFGFYYGMTFDLFLPNNYLLHPVMELARLGKDNKTVKDPRFAGKFDLATGKIIEKKKAGRLTIAFYKWFLRNENPDELQDPRLRDQDLISELKRLGVEMPISPTAI